MHELVPSAVVVGALVNPNNPNAEPQSHDLQAAARTLGLQLIILSAGSDGEIDGVFATMRERKIEALLITADGFFFGLQEKLVSLAARQGIPAFYPLSDYVTAGGLISYGANLSESWRQTGVYVGKIIKGVKPGDLPIMQSAIFELVINLKTAKAFGLTVLQPLLVAADLVIE